MSSLNSEESRRARASRVQRAALLCGLVGAGGLVPLGALQAAEVQEADTPPAVGTAVNQAPVEVESLTASQPVEAAEPAPAKSDALEDLTLEQLMDVKVSTVSRQESTVGQSPAAVFVISSEMIRRSGATTIPELFRMVPGLHVARIDNNSWAISARGFGSDLTNKLLVQVDGRTLYSPIYSGVYWDTVDYPLEDIERIEVVRGPGASVWGSNAVNGIINIITKAAGDTQGALIEAGIGSEDHGFGTFRYGGKSGTKGFYRVYGKGAEFGQGFSNVDANDDWRRAQAGFRLDRNPTERSAFTLQGDFFTVDTGRRTVYPGINNPPTFTMVDTADDESKGGNLLARWTRNAGESNSWSLQAYYDRFDRRATNRLARTSIETADIDFQRQLTLKDRHRLVYGLGYRLQKILFVGSESVDNSFVFGPARTDVDRDVWSAFVQDDIKINDRLGLTLGTKVEHNDYTGAEIQPSGRLLWTPSRSHSAWAAVSRAVRTPSLLENDISISLAPLAPNLPIFLQLNPNQNLKSEEVVAHELGYRIQATEKLSFDTAVFYNKYKRLMAYNVGALGLGPVPGTLLLPLNFANNLKGHSYGLEMAANWNPSNRLKLTGAYTFTRINLQADSSVPADFRVSQEDAEGQTPRHQLYARASLDLPRRLQLDVTSRLVGPLKRSMPSVPGYVAVDARLAWKKNEKMEIAIVGQNLFDSHHLEYGNGMTGSVEIQRAVYGSVTYRW